MHTLTRPGRLLQLLGVGCRNSRWSPHRILAASTLARHKSVSAIHQVQDKKRIRHTRGAGEGEGEGVARGCKHSALPDARLCVLAYAHSPLTTPSPASTSGPPIPRTSLPFGVPVACNAGAPGRATAGGPLHAGTAGADRLRASTGRNITQLWPPMRTNHHHLQNLHKSHPGARSGAPWLASKAPKGRGDLTHRCTDRRDRGFPTGGSPAKIAY